MKLKESVKVRTGLIWHRVQALETWQETLQ
jgi:hypothetical protein